MIGRSNPPDHIDERGNPLKSMCLKNRYGMWSKPLLLYTRVSLSKNGFPHMNERWSSLPLSKCQKSKCCPLSKFPFHICQFDSIPWICRNLSGKCLLNKCQGYCRLLSHIPLLGRKSDSSQTSIPRQVSEEQVSEEQ